MNRHQKKGFQKKLNTPLLLVYLVNRIQLKDEKKRIRKNEARHRVFLNIKH